MKDVCKSRKLKENFGSINFKRAGVIFSLLLIIGLLPVLLTGCKGQAEADLHSKYYYSFTDSLSNTVNLKDKPKRVVSLVGSYAETWIFAGGDLVGVTNDVISERNMDLPQDTNIVGTIKEPNLEEIIGLDRFCYPFS